MSKPSNSDNSSPGAQDEVNEGKHLGPSGNAEDRHKENETESNSSSASHDVQNGSKGVQYAWTVSERKERCICPRMHVSNDVEPSKRNNTHTHNITKIDVGNMDNRSKHRGKATVEEKDTYSQKEHQSKEIQLRSDQDNNDMTQTKATESPEMTEKEGNILHYQKDLEELRGKVMHMENEIKNLKKELSQKDEELNQKEIRLIEFEEKANRTHEGPKGGSWVAQPKYIDKRPQSALPHGPHHAKQVIRIDPTDWKKKIQEQKEQIETLLAQVKITKQECSMLANEKEALSIKVKTYETLLNEEKDKAEKEILRLRKDKDELLNRLSKVASDKLTHENTDITDLSDENRPSKLAEKISELYDNQYTNAFDEYKANGVADKDTVQFLLTILMETHQLCKELTQKRYHKLIKASSCLGISTITDGKDKMDKTMINVELSIELQQDIKRIWRESSKSLLKKARSIIRNRVESQFRFPILTMSKVAEYMTRCIDLCWTMNLQEKPMHLDSSVQQKDGHQYFDSEKFRSYTKTGQYVAFVVWPALYLFEGGAMLKKGIAQGSSIAEGPSDQDVSCVMPVGDQKS